MIGNNRLADKCNRKRFENVPACNHRMDHTDDLSQIEQHCYWR